MYNWIAPEVVLRSHWHREMNTTSKSALLCIWEEQRLSELRNCRWHPSEQKQKPMRSEKQGISVRFSISMSNNEQQHQHTSADKRFRVLPHFTLYCSARGVNFLLIIAKYLTPFNSQQQQYTNTRTIPFVCLQHSDILCIRRTTKNAAATRFIGWKTLENFELDFSASNFFVLKRVLMCVCVQMLSYSIFFMLVWWWLLLLLLSASSV